MFQMVFIKSRKFPFHTQWFPESFDHEWVLKFVKCFFWVYSVD